MSTRDAIVVGLVVVAFAVLVTAHVWIVAGLLRRPPRWRAPVALFAFPLAPYWAIREHMRARGVVWIAAAVAYVVVRVIASA